jgi:hypothetical protein
LEIASAIKVLRARALALQMLKTVDRFRLGVTSKAEVESKLLELKLTPEDEACSAPVGSCEGIGVVLSNYPQLPNGNIAGIIDYVLGKIIIFRPTYLIGNFYFYSDRLQSGGVSFSTDDASVGTEFASSDSGQDAIPQWRRNNRTGNESYFRILDSAHQKETSLGSADLFDLGCMASFMGCNTATKLWPSISQYKTH